MALGATLYLQGSVEAAAFYMEAFGMELGYHVRNPDGTYLHAELSKNGIQGFAISESPSGDFAQTMLGAQFPTMSYGLSFEEEAQLRKAYDMLGREGHILRPLGVLPWSPLSADVVDKYGVYWYITLPQHRPK